MPYFRTHLFSFRNDFKLIIFVCKCQLNVRMVSTQAKLQSKKWQKTKKTTQKMYKLFTHADIWMLTNDFATSPIVISFQIEIIYTYITRKINTCFIIDRLFLLKCLCRTKRFSFLWKYYRHVTIKLHINTEFT